MDSNKIWDCVIVGGGAAGLSAALVLGRARRTTLLIDSGGQSNLVSHGVGGLLGHDGQPPFALYAAGRRELTAYPTVEVREGEVVGGAQEGTGFTLELAGGSHEAARRVLLATGMDYRYPQVPGIAQRWGRSVFHCPFCHGWEVRDLALGVLDGSAAGVHRALLLRMWSDDLTLFTNGPAEIDEADAQTLAAAGVTVDDRPVARLVGDAPDLSAVQFEDGSQRPCGGLLIPVTMFQRSGLAGQLGAEPAEPGPVAADAVEVDPMFQTGVPGLFAAGDLSAQMPSVANAVAAGSKAAAAVVGSLISEPHNPPSR
ncbi:MAG: NAD(P)/FAD-dependent oxidoreductase [Actinomycetota bacterium]